MARRNKGRHRLNPNQLAMDFLWGSDEPDVEERSDEPVRDDSAGLLPRAPAEPVQRNLGSGGVLRQPGPGDPAPGRGPDAAAGGTGSGRGGLPGQGGPAERGQASGRGDRDGGPG